MVLGLGKAKGIIEIAIIGLAVAFAVPLASAIPRVYKGTTGLIEQIASGISGATSFVGGISESVTESVTTTICDYDFLNVNPICDAEPTVVDDVISPPAPVKENFECNPLLSCRATGQQLTKCLTTHMEFDDKGNSICNCGYDQQCEDDHLQQECQNTTDMYWELGQCKPYKFINPAEPFIPLEDAVDDVTGEKVQDILNDRFVDAGGDLQECENKGGIVVGNYFTSTQSDVVTTCVPKERVPVTTRYSLERHCQDYCNRNNYDIGSINVQTNTCVCDNIPQIHLSDLTGLSTADIDKVLS